MATSENATPAPASVPAPAPTPVPTAQGRSEYDHNHNHDPPSQPASPVAKRTKILVDDDSHAIGSGGGGGGTAALAGDSTPTPAPTALPVSMPRPGAEAGTGTASRRIRSNAAAAATAAAETIPLQVKILSDKGRAPTRGSAFAAGYDLYSARDITVEARGKALVDTDISMAVPAGTYGRIAPRSGLASKHSIDVGAGVIDADYRGPLKILLFNFSDVAFAIKEGDRIAQLVLERIYTPEVMVVDELEQSVRGVGGFGSTGGFAAV